MFRIRAFIRHKKSKSRKMEVKVVSKTILKKIENNALNFTEMEKVEILKTVLSDFKALKSKQGTQARKQAEKIEEALKELG